MKFVTSKRALLVSPKKVTVTSSYTGPGDIASSALGWWGLRAYNAAYATGSNPAIDVVDQAGSNAATFNILSSGALDTASISTWVTAHSVTTIKVSKLYDQASSTYHMLEGTLANMPTLVLNSLNTLPTLNFTSSQQMGTTGTAIPNQNAPLTFSWLLKDLSAANARAILLDDTFITGITSFTSGSSIEQLVMANTQGTAQVGSINQTNYHSLEGLCAIGSGAMLLNIDGSTGTGTGAAGSPILHNLYINPGFDAPGAFNMTELGLWASDQSAHFTALISNKTTYWGPL